MVRKEHIPESIIVPTENLPSLPGQSLRLTPKPHSMMAGIKPLSSHSWLHFYSPHETTFRPSFLPPTSCPSITCCFYHTFGPCIRVLFCVSLPSLHASGGQRQCFTIFLFPRIHVCRARILCLLLSSLSGIKLPAFKV